ncbi:hypothetical protein [Micromonospora chalcea]|uniref:hypothetical protein n=1 Tax=Micromonospora chalcea TaxID=1874 RepID=UPI003D741411
MNGYTAARDVGVRTARWLAKINGRGPLQQVLQVVAKPAEELAEVLAAMAAGDFDGAVAECCDVVFTARTAQATIGQPAWLLRDDRMPEAREAPDAHGGVEVAQRLLTQAVAELGGVAIAWMGQNPRKLAANGGTLPVEVVSDRLDEVVHLACQMIRALGHDADQALLEDAARVHHRLDGLEVPR